MYKNILVPLDGSALAENALSHACRLASAENSRLILLRALLKTEYVVDTMGHVLYAPGAQLGDRLHADAERYLGQVADTLAYPYTATVVRTGLPADVIVDSCTEEEVDLLIMSTHGRTGLDRLVIGSVAERVVRRTRHPIWIVRSDRPPRQILVPVDGSQRSHEILRHAGRLAQVFDAGLILLHVMHGENAQDIGYLDRLAAEQLPADVTPKLLQYSGEPSDMILTAAEAYDVDVIAMSTRGHRGINRLRYGSITHHILHNGGRSMFMIRPSI